MGTTIIEEPSHILGAILISKQTILLFTNKGSICDFYLDGVSRNKTAQAVFVELLELYIDFLSHVQIQELINSCEKLGLASKPRTSFKETRNYSAIVIYGFL